jgi:hypothetical protein
MPAVLERNAALFDSIGDAMGRIKAKATGFFAGIMEGIAPALKSITDSLETIDFTKWGVEIGKVIGILIEAFKEGKLGTMVGLSLMIGFGEAVNFLVGTIGSAQFWKGVGELVLGAFLGIGGALLKIFMTPITYLQAGMDKVVDELFAALGKVPGISKAMGLENYGEAKSFKEHLTDREQNGFFLKDAANASSKMSSDMMASGMANLREGMKPKNVIDTSEWKSTLSDLWGGLSATFEAKRKDLQEASNTLVPVGTNSLQAIGPEAKLQRTNLEIASDRLSKIGLYVGGGAIDLSKRTAAATERMAKSLDKYLPKLVPAGGTTATWEA